MNRPSYHQLRVLSVIDETPDARSFAFELPPTLSEQFRYRPGQFLTLRVPHGDGYLPRCYSLASSPGAEEPLRVTVKRVRDGRASNWVCDTLQAGDHIEVMPPAGVFTPKSLAGDFLLLAGGSGITPVFSILRSALAAGEGRICLIYANRDPQSIIFRDELRTLANAYPHRLQVIHWLDLVQGVPSVAQLAALAAPWRQADCFICGPSMFMDAAVEALHALDIPPSHIHVERFVSLPEEGQAEEEPRTGTGQQVHIEVELNGARHELYCSDQEPILDAMLRAGVEAPYSCRAGACATCMCTLVSGKVRLHHNDVLDKNDLAEGWTLACQAVPESGPVRVRFPD